MVIPPKPFLNQLVGLQKLDQESADRYEIEALRSDIPIDQFLLEKTNVDKNAILQAKANFLHVPFIDIANAAIDPQALTFIPESVARRYRILPYNYDVKNDILSMASENPLDLAVVDFIEKKTNKKTVFALAFPDQIAKMIDLSYSQGLSPEIRDALEEASSHQHTQTQVTTTSIREAPIAKIVDTILEFAIKSRASDVHIEPEETKTRVRYRIDGILQEKLILPKTIHESLISRIKILSEMKIDEKRVPQDGRFDFALGNEQVDLRVSSLPTVNGEKIVMRLLKKTGGMPSLNDLGLRGTQFKDLEEAISKPYGIILVTGPTGSGKTTTLYSVLNRLNKPGVNIVTLEDPVEYQIEGLNQVQINPQAGLTFANGLRSFLRQDPNIILVGEIRDKETTQLAIQAALTGHLVFSTLHTNDASTAIPRLIDLGGEPFLIASVLNASVAQRIARRTCPYCKKTYEPAPSIKDNIKAVLADLLPAPYQSNQRPMLLTKGEGCNECAGSGYLGRIAIFEVLKITSTINRMILREASAREIVEQAKKEGLIIMKQDGYLKALEGVTTIEEVLRIAEV
ncbi:GspE/PulE family protein [Patescibacteria group bacterium]|nr:GspE/PulE family protein [Patescibacteria group bacterium]MCL5091859.1 GspE/PulE family protein [Patescibacteria group bacterium]